MRILLTGATGQIGWELARLLPAWGEVTMPSSRELDLANQGQLQQYLHDLQPDLLVNAAAFTDVDRAEAEPERAWRINAHAVRIMAEAMAQRRGLLVHYSTDYVFDGQQRAPYRENDPAGPLNEYGFSKREGERALAESGVAYWNFRTSWVYGWRGRNFLRTILRLAEQREPLRVVNDQRGAPTWCRFVAEATCEVLRQTLGEPGSGGRPELSSCGTYHLTGGGEATWFEFAREILELHAATTGPQPDIVPISTAEFPRPARRPPYSVLNTDKLARTFGVTSPGWRQQLRECFRAHPTDHESVPAAGS